MIGNATAAAAIPTRDYAEGTVALGREHSLEAIIQQAHTQADRCEEAMSMLVDALSSVLEPATPGPAQSNGLTPVAKVLPPALDRVDLLRARLSALTALADMTRERLAL